jgi:uncharacterized protein
LNQRRSSGTLQDLRKPLPWPEAKPFRILSIDGGGIRGILPAAVLSELERRYLSGKSVGDYFDLITGTSTGGIVALGLSIGLPAERVLSLYLEHGPKIFPPAKFDFFKLRSWWRKIQAYQHHRYDAKRLETLLSKIFTDKMVGDATRRLCIPSFDGFTEVTIFKTPHHKDYRLDWSQPMVAVAMATAAAPSYFPVYKNGTQYFADGGVWANNPVMIGLTDALVCNDVPRRQVHILSIGTGDTEIRFTENQILHGGMIDWSEIISSAMHLQSQNADGQAGLLIGRDQLIRLNAKELASNPMTLDDYSRASSELPAIAGKLIDERGSEIRDRFLFEPAEPYKPFYGPRMIAESWAESVTAGYYL